MLRAVGPLRRLAALAVLAGVWAMTATAAHAKPPQTHIVIDAASGKELTSSAPDMLIHPASLTKMMTLYILFDDLKRGRFKLGSRVRFSRKAAGRPPSKLGVRAGRSISVKTAILALSVKSGNDVAVALAEKMSGSVEKFAKRMNKTAEALGMSRTHFVNPSGLPHPKQVSTARDMAKLARALRYRHKRYYKYFKAKSFKYAGRTYKSHNRFLKMYKGADGLKTGYINASGFNLAASAVRGGRRLIGVVIGGRSSAGRNKTMVQVMDAGYRAARSLGKPKYLGAYNTALDWRSGKIVMPPRREREIRLPPTRPVMARMETLSPSGQVIAAEVGGQAGGGAYAAQVGAVTTQTAAVNLAQKRLRVLGETVDGGAPAVKPLRLKSGRKLYRARIGGLSGAQAKAACDKLRKSGRDCLVVAEASG